MALEQSNGGMDPEALAAMMQQMGGKGNKKKKEREPLGHYRFLSDQQRPRGLEARVGWDPLESVLYKNKRREYSDKLDRSAWSQSLYSYAIHSPNFLPFHEIMLQKKWNNDDKLYAVSSLLNLEVSPDLVIKGQDVTPLQRALELRERMIALRFIEHGADLSKTDMHGNTPIMEAVRTGQTELLVPMLRKDAKAGTNLKGENIVDLALQSYLVSGDDDKLATSLHAIKKFKIGFNDPEPWISDSQRRLLLTRRKNAPLDGENARLAALNVLLQKIDQDNTPVILQKHPPLRAHSNPLAGYRMAPVQMTPISGGFIFDVIDGLTGGYFSKTAAEGGRSLITAKKEFEQTLTEVSVMKLLKTKPSPSDTIAYSRFLDKLSELNKDAHFINLKLGDLDENLIHYAIRQHDEELLKYAINQGSNINGLDLNGQSPMHLLASEYSRLPADNANRDLFVRQLSQLIGMGGPNGSRQPMNNEGNYGDWFLTDTQGRTFLDVLSEIRPEWVSHIHNVLQIPKDTYESPQEILKISYTEPASLQPTDVPALMPLGPMASTTDKMEKSIFLQEWLHKIYTRISESISDEDKKEFQLKAENLLNNSEIDIQIHALIEMSAQIDRAPDPVNTEAVNALLSYMSHKIEQGSSLEQDQIFRQFDDVMRTADEQGKDLRMLQGLWVQLGTLTNNPEMLKMGSRIEQSLSRIAQQKYGTLDENENNPIQRGHPPAR